MSLSPADEAAIAQGQTFPWHELYVPDVQAATDFYTSTLGFGSAEMPMGEMGTYKMLTRNGRPICGMMSTTGGPAAGVPPHWAVYLSVEDVDGSVEACVAKGAKVVVPAMDVPSVGRMTLISDPQGAHIWLFQSAEE